MNMLHFQKRFSQSVKAPTWFLKEIKELHSPLDCHYNHLENRWMIIQWQGQPLNSSWFWVMTIQSPDKGPMVPNSYALDRLRWLKKIFEQNEVERITELEELKEEERQKKHTQSYMHELAKDIRKPMLANFDGLVSTYNRFI